MPKILKEFFNLHKNQERESWVNTQRAFTLIELLVVIAIISLLSSVVLASLSNARASARDARRKQDMRQFEIAAQLYYGKHGHFPAESGTCRSSSWTMSNCDPETGWLTTGGIYDLVEEGFMSQLPVDPINDSTYFYIYEPDNNVSPKDDFCIRAKLEDGGYVYAHAGDSSSFSGCGS